MENSTSGVNSSVKTAFTNGRVGEAASNAHSAVDKVAAVAGSLVQGVNATIDNVAASGHEAVKKVESAIQPAEKWVDQKTEALLAVPKNAVSDARDYIVAHPWQSVGVAVLAGMFLARKGR